MSTPPGWSAPPPPPPPPPEGAGGGGLRPLNLGDVLDGMFRLLLRHWRAYVGAIAAVVVPVQLLVAFLQRDLVDVGLLDMFNDPTVAPTQVPDLQFGSAMAAGLLTSLLVSPLVTGLACFVAARGHLGGEPTAGDALGTGFRRYLPLVTANFITVVLRVVVVVGLLLLPLAFSAVVGDVVAVVLVIPFGLGALAAVMAIYTLLLVTPVVVMVEERGPLAAIGRSAKLVRSRFWSVLGVGLLAWIIATVINTVMAWPFALVAALFGGTVSLVVTTLGAIVAGILAAPLMPNAIALLYVDLRVRVEGLDVEAMTDALEGPGEGHHPA